MIFFRKKKPSEIPDGFNLSDRPRVAILVEATIPPVSRANLRMYWLAKGLIKEKKVLVNMIAPSKDFKSRHSYFIEWIWMNQYPGISDLLYSKFRLPVRIWHFLASIASVIILEYYSYRWRSGRGFSVIHAWNPLAGLAGVIAGKIIRRPVFVDFTDFYSDIATTDMPFFRTPLIWLENYVLRRAAKVFVVSEEMREHLIEIKDIQPEKIHVVPDGTDAETFVPCLNTDGIREKLGISAEAPLMVFHGDIKHDDGVDVLCNAFSVVLKRRPDARLLILGGGLYFEKGVRLLIDKLNIGHAVIAPGWIPHTEVPKYLNTCDIGAMTMRATLNHNYYLSFKLFEYWGCGKPIVVTRLSAISRVVKHGVNGLIVDNEDVEGFASAFLELIENREKARSLGAEGRRLVEKEYDWRQIMKKEIECYPDFNH